MPKSDPRVKVAVESFGEGIPGGDNVLTARVENTSGKTIRVRPSLTLTPADGKAKRATTTTAIPPGVGEIQVPYDVEGTGSIAVVFKLDPRIAYSAKTTFEVSPLYESSYGETLPGSNGVAGLWWASSGWKVARTRPAPRATGTAVRIQAARNEAEAAQLVVRPTKDLRGFIARSGALSGPGGATIPSENIEVLRVRYVQVTVPTDKVGAAAPWPDPLPPFKGPIDVPANQNQPLWVRVTVPENTPTGTYKGVIELAADGYAADAPLEVTVFDFALLDRMTCTTAFGMSIGNAFRYQGVTDPEDQRAVADKYLANYSAHHISPYGPALLESVEVTWPALDKARAASAPLDKAALTPVFDWTAWDAAMERAFDEYHFNSFRLGIPGIRGEIVGLAEGTPEHKLAFTAYCQTLQEHLREKGWLDEAYVYWYDEPARGDYEYVMEGFRKLKEAAPDLRRMLTEQVEPELVGGPNLWCPMSHVFDPKSAVERRAEGDDFWWYICTIPKEPFAGLFIDHPGTELRVWLWQTWERRVSGILIWQTNYWTSPSAYPDSANPQSPYEDPMGWTSGYGTASGAKAPWGNGDGRFVYPPEAAADAHPDAPVLDGPVDSIRWEMLRDGIEDYEYMAMLDRLLERHRNRLTVQEREQYEALLEVPDAISRDMSHFTVDPAPIEAHRNAVARALEALHKLE